MSVTIDGAQSVPLGYYQTELGLLPEDWSVSDIGSLEPFVTSGSRGWASFYSDTGAPFIRITNLSRECIDLHLVDLKRVDLPEKAFAEALRTELRDGDLLISITADVGIVGIVDRRTPKPAYMNQHLALIRFNKTQCFPRFIAYSLASERPQRLFRASVETGAKAGMNLLTVRAIQLALPQLQEQKHISQALSDVDGLIGALDRLITKKRAIKQAAMQQLLTGKTRLPGFAGKWKITRIGDISTSLPTANNPRADLSEQGDVEYIHYGDVHACAQPIVICSRANLPRIDKNRVGNAAKLKDGDLVMVDASEDLEGVGKSIEVQGLAGRTVVAGLHTILCRGNPGEWANGFKAYLQFIPTFKSALTRVATGISVYAVSKRRLEDVQVPMPSVPEQEAIVSVLSDMDHEIFALGRRWNKAKEIKQGMMQQLLTGRVRLLKSQGSRTEHYVNPQPTAHSWAFNEAVVISVLAKQFGTEQFPMGRKRYTKLSYLLHRRVEQNTEGYLKKAAGPYNPKTKYGGPERIAIERGYIREHKNGPYRGFIAAQNFADADGYFEKWYGIDCVKWLEQFRFIKNDELEVLATVDMAAEDLRVAGKSVDVDNVKGVISSNPEWQAKLSRAAFSDIGIRRAIETTRRLFG